MTKNHLSELALSLQTGYPDYVHFYGKYCYILQDTIICVYIPLGNNKVSCVGAISVDFRPDNARLNGYNKESNFVEYLTLYLTAGLYASVNLGVYINQYEAHE